MNHQTGKDPTPQGRTPGNNRPDQKQPPKRGINESYEHSTPGPEIREDGSYFFGYKRELPGRDRSE